MHLNTLNADQLGAWENFKRWFETGEGSRVLAGAGGTGKTYAIGKFCKEYGLKYSEVLGLAPTHAAKNQLESALADSGFHCAVTTIHSALLLSPQRCDWGTEQIAMLYDLTEQRGKYTAEPYSEANEERIASLDARIRYMHRIKKAVRDNELLFNIQNDVAGAFSGYKLVIVDEGGMVNQEIHDLLIATEARILFMGDTAQLPPVKEKVSKALEHPQLAELSIVERSRGDVAKVIECVRKCDSMRTASAVLKNLDRWEGQQEGAYLVDKSQAISAIELWARELPHDGSSFRAIAHTNRAVNVLNRNIRKIAGYKKWGISDLVIANNNITRTLDKHKSFEIITPEVEDLFGNKRWINRTLIRTSDLGRIADTFGVNVVKVPTNEGIVEFQVLTAWIEFEESETALLKELGCIQVYGASKKSFSGYKEGQPIFERGMQVNLLEPKDAIAYSEALEFWSNCHKSFYGKGGSKPENGLRADTMLDFFGLETWANVPGTPGRKRFKVDTLEGQGFKLDYLQTDGYAVKNFQDLRKKVARVYHWINGLSDNIRPRTATTVYKAQGASIERVLIHLDDMVNCLKHSGDIGQRALYTGVSRASKLLLIYDSQG